MQIAQLYSIFLEYPSIQTDTRKLQSGDIFFALKGDNFNGNLFAKQALEKGAAYVIVDEEPGFTDKRIITTTDVLTTLQLLAKHHREQFNIPFIAITGSNGKTTTKELIHEVLTTSYKTYTTKGNLNNHIGIPLTILSVKKDAAIAVIEMGANHQKEIQGYCEYTKPTHGLITNVGKAHLEGFGGEEGVRKGKGELFDYLRANKGTAFIFHDFDYLLEMSSGIDNIISYGTKNADIIGNALQNENEYLQVVFEKGTSIKKINTNLVGTYNLPNVLAAVTLGKYFTVDDEKIKTALENYVPSNSRSQLIEKDSNKIILDAYNANPSSMKAAIENFVKMKADNKILLLGGMMELGYESVKEHQSIINLIQSYGGWKQVVLVGGDYNKTTNPFINFSNAAEAKQWFQQQHFSNATILVKGSRSMQMEKVLE
ncbi:UDP-N-acetylmuramoyl-tripeptide--D-alanyl-D-alanine ligase [Ferruginibacter albus]|uniref:UDP-N-acetylmuramoyl-tripeptide--D-alanyl-D- alanine ligase n=1 Tax=Ferruginibacter albus TaxID=2875540 RepID=UPI001CC4AFDD|nr:UDP-N-acetylmuramoyl-tripeptide--D-alanyl-D-alanine ligase [Ferruginibacter albus]UAY51418.1 UDP-N-acetylmuramoyl-tripeptide--D-alanyl-D-alanine ligase [Ferruginibacter albus]